MRLNAKIVGVNKLLSKFKGFEREGVARVEAITKLTAHDIEADAKKFAPVDMGKLRQGIKAEELNPLSYRILAAEVYSAFQEFGTGGLVDVPKGWEALAIQFKGEGKKQINMPAQPFMYPAFKKGEKNYHKDLKKALAVLTNKYNKK